MNQYGNVPEAPPRTYAIYSLLKVYGINQEMDQELHKGLLFILRKCTRSSTEDLCSYSLLKVYGISEEMEKELH